MTSISHLTFKLLSLKAIKGIGPATLREVQEFIHLESNEMIELISRKFPVINMKSYSLGKEIAKKQVEIAEKLGHKIVSFLDNDYPISLRNIANSPVILYVSGKLDFLNEKNIAVIGTRNPTPNGMKIASRVTQWLCSNNWNVVSGLAKGVDTLAHETCISAGKKTTAVLAHGLDINVYPKENMGLAEKILETDGALVSEYPYGITVRPAQLVQRDKIQAALSAGVVLIQSGEKGGSLHASREIIKYKRPLVVVGQSKSDLLTSPSQLMANIILLGEDKGKACNLLKTNSYPSDLLIKMHSRNYYSSTLSALDISLMSIQQSNLYQQVNSNGDFDF
ncbi:DNA-processing protein DprA [Pseudoalteromonas sp. 1181_04]|uniref:DNA-processing protein DprA n=1 Tax=Pseudoalteromonas sp. 1181_04 TaxID=2604450 RepID=UPI004062D3AF